MAEFAASVNNGEQEALGEAEAAGITIIKPSDATRNGWRVRFLDPELQYRNGRKTGIKKFRFETIPAEPITAKERKEWCQQNARLAGRELLRSRSPPAQTPRKPRARLGRGALCDLVDIS